MLSPLRNRLDGFASCIDYFCLSASSFCIPGAPKRMYVSACILSQNHDITTIPFREQFHRGYKLIPCRPSHFWIQPFQRMMGTTLLTTTSSATTKISPNLFLRPRPLQRVGPLYPTNSLDYTLHRRLPARHPTNLQISSLPNLHITYRDSLPLLPQVPNQPCILILTNMS